MGNLTSLAWTTSFGGIALGIMFIIIAMITYFRKKVIEKAKIFIVILAIVYLVYDGLPYISDYVSREEKYIYGTVVEETSRTYRTRTTVYSYTLQAESGELVTVHVTEKYYDTLGMEVGKQYNVSYFAHSKAVIEVEESALSFSISAGMPLVLN